ncbi:MAG: DNA repair protein RecN [Bacteroidota bacterium]
MLKNLSITNYALIDALEMDFYPGFTTITGETGAGKSIILDALSLIIGQRADAQVLLNKTKKCIIEGCFDISSYNLSGFFKKHELDFDTNVLLRREINPEGKSRAFINDTPVNLSQLKELGDSLIDIHSQHKTLQINDTGFQLYLIDSYAHIVDEVAVYKKEFVELKEMKKLLQLLTQTEAKASADKDYFTFLFNELDAANLRETEQVDLEQELDLLNHVELIKSTLNKSLYALNGAEGNIILQLAAIQNQLSQIIAFNKEIEGNAQRLQTAYIELKDITSELEHIEEHTLFKPERSEQINSRLNEIYRLQQKHRVDSIAELLDVYNKLDNKIQDIASLESKIYLLVLAIEQKEKELWVVAEKLSAKRKSIFTEIEQKAVGILVLLGMPNARIKTENIKSAELKETGIDDIVFTFSANTGSEMKPIDKVASGGELSRLMLAFKSLVSEKKLLPTIIFDEIDSGVSGEVASQTATIMKNLSKGMQVIAITHLPQIAAKGNVHMQVYKVSDKNATYVRIKKLEIDARVDVIAEMLSGSNSSQASVITAKELLS